MANEKHGAGESPKHILHITVNDKRYDWPQQYITGAEIRKIANLPDDDLIFLAVKKPWEDEKITDDKSTDLARPEVEHFYSKNPQFSVCLIVNLREKTWIEKTITFDEVVILAYGKIDNNDGKGYTITYDRGPHHNPEGTMVKGDRVFVKDKMIFNVKETDRS